MRSFKSLVDSDLSREQIEEWCRQRTQSYPDGLGAIVSRVLGKYIMYSASNDTALTPHLALDGIWEPWISMAIARHLTTGMSCLDVGACYGYYSLLMSDIVGSAGYVEAWEPIWGKALLKNAEVNGLPVTLQSHLMGTQDGALYQYQLTTHEWFNAGGIDLVPEPNALLAGTSQATMRRPDKPQVWNFIKIDVEGMEHDVWEALRPSLAVSPEVTVCMEFTPGAHADPMGFLRQVEQDGFKLGTVGHDSVPRAVEAAVAGIPDTGDFRMLWLTR